MFNVSAQTRAEIEAALAPVHEQHACRWCAQHECAQANEHERLYAQSEIVIRLKMEQRLKCPACGGDVRTAGPCVDKRVSR